MYIETIPQEIELDIRYTLSPNMQSSYDIYFLGKKTYLAASNWTTTSPQNWSGAGTVVSLLILSGNTSIYSSEGKILSTVLCNGS